QSAMPHLGQCRSRTGWRTCVGARQGQYRFGAALGMVVQTDAAAAALAGGVTQTQAEPQALARGRYERLAELVGDVEADARPAIANAQGDGGTGPVERELQRSAVGVGGVVEQIYQRLPQRFVSANGWRGGRTIDGTTQLEARRRPHHLPALKQLAQELIGGLQCMALRLVSLGGADQFPQCRAAVMHLLLQQVDIGAQL